MATESNDTAASLDFFISSEFFLASFPGRIATIKDAAAAIKATISASVISQPLS
jgi:hypothetical protein